MVRFSRVTVSLSHRLYRRLYWLKRDWPTLRQVGRSPVILYAGIGGIGDELICTAAAHELKRRGVRNLTVLVRHPELFAHNPDADRVLAATDDAMATAENWAFDLRRPCEWQKPDPQDPDRQFPPRDHIVAENCRRAGVSGEIALRPYFYLTETERSAGILSPRQVAIHTSGRAARYHFRNKEWRPERLQAVVDELHGEFDFVQLGAPDDPPLQHVRDLRGRTSLRESAAVLAGSRFLVGLVG